MSLVCFLGEIQLFLCIFPSSEQFSHLSFHKIFEDVFLKISYFSLLKKSDFIVNSTLLLCSTAAPGEVLFIESQLNVFKIQWQEAADF
jgi:hypothetical protein